MQYVQKDKWTIHVKGADIFPAKTLVLMSGEDDIKWQIKHFLGREVLLISQNGFVGQN